MPHTQKITEALFGARLDPFDQRTRKHVTLVAFLAWVGLGADGLSSSRYGPEEAFLALGTHTHLALYMAIATALTVFISPSPTIKLSSCSRPAAGVTRLPPS